MLGSPVLPDAADQSVLEDTWSPCFCTGQKYQRHSDGRDNHGGKPGGAAPARDLSRTPGTAKFAACLPRFSCFGHHRLQGAAGPAHWTTGQTADSETSRGSTPNSPARKQSPNNGQATVAGTRSGSSVSAHGTAQGGGVSARSRRRACSQMSRRGPVRGSHGRKKLEEMVLGRSTQVFCRGRGRWGTARGFPHGCAAQEKTLLVWGPSEIVITWLGKALDEMMLGLAATGDHGTGWVR